MHRETILIILGVIVAISSFIGLPMSLLHFLLPILGLLIVFIGATLRNRRRVWIQSLSHEESVQ